MEDTHALSLPEVKNPVGEYSVQHALAEGFHDGVSSIVKYLVTFGTLAMVGVLVLDAENVKRIKRRFL